MSVNGPHPVDIYAGKKLRLKRTILGLSQESLGNSIGVTFQQIQKYERGINRMSSSRLFEFSKVLKVPVAYFFEGYEESFDEAGEKIEMLGMAEETASFEHDDQLSSRETLEMMRAYYRIADPNIRKKIFELVKSLAEREN
jgi:transcriptional regulator with XRE-family HTH domain